MKEVSLFSKIKVGIKFIYNCSNSGEKITLILLIISIIGNILGAFLLKDFAFIFSLFFNLFAIALHIIYIIYNNIVLHNFVTIYKIENENKDLKKTIKSLKKEIKEQQEPKKKSIRKTVIKEKK